MKDISVVLSCRTSLFELRCCSRLFVIRTQILHLAPPNFCKSGAAPRCRNS